MLTSKNGWTPFGDTNLFGSTQSLINERGGIKRLVKLPYARNNWAIMKEFKVLPTDERFLNLTIEQKAFILENMELDAKEHSRALKGLSSKDVYEDDEKFWDKPYSEFNPAEGVDQKNVATQLDNLFEKEDVAKAKARFKNTEEYVKYLDEGGEHAKRMVTDNYMEEQLKQAYEDVERINKYKGQMVREEEKPEKIMSKLEKETIKEAVDLFNKEEDDDFWI